MGAGGGTSGSSGELGDRTDRKDGGDRVLGESIAKPSRNGGGRRLLVSFELLRSCCERGA